MKVKGTRLDVAPLTKVSMSNAERGPFFFSELCLGHQSDCQLCVGQQQTILWLITTTILPFEPLYSHAHQRIQVKESPRQQWRRMRLTWLDPAESCKGSSVGAMLPRSSRVDARSQEALRLRPSVSYGSARFLFQKVTLSKDVVVQVCLMCFLASFTGSRVFIIK